MNDKNELNIILENAGVTTRTLSLSEIDLYESLETATGHFHLMREAVTSIVLNSPEIRQGMEDAGYTLDHILEQMENWLDMAGRISGFDE